MFGTRKRRVEESSFRLDTIQEFLDAAEAAALLITPQRRIAYMNGAAEERWGRITGEPCFKLLRDSSKPCGDCPLEEVLEHKALARRETRMWSPGGWTERENIYMRVVPEGGSPLMALVSTEMPERKVLEREVRRERELSKALLESMNALVVGLDQSGDVSFVNKAAERVTGFTDSEIKAGGGIDLLVPAEYQVVAREYFGSPPLEPRAAEAVLIPLVNRSGGRRMISWTYSPLRMGDGQAEGAIALGQDVTERFARRRKAEKLAEELLVVNAILSKAQSAVVLDEMLEAALSALLTLPGYRCGAAYLLNKGSEEAVLAAHRGFQRAVPRGVVRGGAMDAFPISTLASGRIEMAVAGCVMHPSMKDAMELEELEGAFAVPIFISGRPAALMLLGHDLAPDKAEEGLDLLKAAAEALQLGAEKARLRQRAEERAREATALLNVAQNLTGTLDLTSALVKVAADAAELLQVDRCNIWLFDEARQVLVPRAGHDWTPADRQPGSIPISAHGAADEARRTLKPVMIFDAERDPRMPAAEADRYQIKSSLVVPLVIDGGFTGTLTLDMTSRRRRFTERDIELMESFARQASIAMQKASLVEELRHSEERYRVLADSSLIGLCVHNGVDVLYANERAFEIVGHDREDIRSLDDILAMIVPGERERVARLVEGFVKGGKPVNIKLDLELQRKDGSRVMVETMSNRVHFEGQRAFMVTIIDSTQRIEAEKALKASEERYRALVETSTDSIIISGPEGEMKFVNSASELLMGMKAEELIGENIYSFVHPDERSEIIRDFSRAWELGRGVTRYPIRVLVHGTDKFFEATTALLGEPGPDADVMVIVRDVTERERAQRMIRESEERYRTIVETSRDLIIMTNRAGEILYANPAVSDIFGHSQDEIRGKYFFEFVSMDDRERASRDFVNDWRTGSTIPNYPLTICGRDGSTRQIEASSGLVGWPGEDAVQIFVIRDVTERKQRESERELQLRIDEAMAAIAGTFVDPEDIYESIGMAMREAGELLGVSRSFFIELTEDRSAVSRAVEWCAPGRREIAGEVSGALTDDFEWWRRELGSRGEVVFSGKADLPTTARQETLGIYTPEAAAVVPVLVHDELAGALGLNHDDGERKWSSQELNLLRELARTISRAIERRQWVEQLGRSERFRKRITDSIGEGLFVLRDGIISWANNQACEIYGYEPEEMTGRSPEFLLADPRRLQAIAVELLDALREEGIFMSEEKARRKNGALIDTLISITSLGVTEEGQGEIVTVVRDITEAKEMQAVVTAAAEAYSTIFSTAGDAMIVHTLSGEIREANERATLYTGYSQDELRRMNVMDLLSPEAGELYFRRQDELLRDGVSTIETHLMRKDGGGTPVEVTSRRTGIWGETVVLSAYRDTTERHKAEAETRRRTAQLASLNEIVKAATSSLDLETILDSILKVMVEVSGAEPGMIILRPHPKRAEYMPRSSVGRVPGMLKLIESPGSREFLEDLMDSLESSRLIETAANVENPVLAGFVRSIDEIGRSQVLMVPLKSGETVTGMIGLAADGSLDERDLGFYDAAGAEIGVAVENALIYRELTAEHERLSLLYRTAQGISGELELEALLDRTAEEAARAVGATHALVALTDPPSDEFKWSASFNLVLGSLSGTTLSSDRGIGERVTRSKRALLISASGSGGMLDAEPLASTLGLRYGAAVPLVSGDQVLGILMLLMEKESKELTAEDVLLLEAIGRQAGIAIENARLYEETRRHLEAVEKAHEELKVLDRMKSDFVSTVSHELRSPLAVIEGFAKTMVEHFEQIDRETERESLEIILKKSVALEGLIANILDMSRIEEGRLEVQAEELELAELCERIRDDQETVDESHEICLELETRPIIVVADREKTEVALGNLVRNAMKFSPDGGKVRISAKTTDRMAEISVADEGIGIPPDELERVFERFYQVDSGETRSFPGSGLGLYITRELVQAMGGEISVRSEPAHGSVFTLTLPLAR